MGNINKKYIIRKAESILEECRINSDYNNMEKNNIISLKTKNKKLKRKIIFLKLCLMSLGIIFLATRLIK